MKLRKITLIILVVLLCCTSIGNVTARAEEGTSLVTDDGFKYCIDDNETDDISDDIIEITGYVGKNVDIEIPSEINGIPVTSIGYEAFWKCNLTKVTIPDSVTSIGERSFVGIGIIVTIPDSVTSIGRDAFTSRIHSVIFANSNSYGAKWGNDNGFNVRYPDKELVTDDGLFNYIVEDGVKITSYNGSSENVVIPDSIAGVPVKNMGISLFASDSNIKSVKLPSGLTNISDFAFYECGITSINIPNGVDSIGEEAFSCCKNLENVTIPNSVTRIGRYAFWACSSLGNITIPDSVAVIEDSAFASCTNLDNVTIPRSVASIETCTFAGCTSLKNITIPNSVTSIGNNAFEKCNNLENIIIPGSVKNIGGYAFSQCTNLKNVTLSYGITNIGQYAFSHCISLDNVIIPDSVERIGTWAFSWCDNLTNIKISNNVTELNGGTFYNCSNLESLVIPDNVKQLGLWEFCLCTNLKSITIPDGMTMISSWAFNGCEGLERVVIPSSVTNIGAEVFSGCDSVTVYAYRDSYAAKWANEQGYPVNYIDVDITYHTHIQSYGDSQGTMKNGAMAGTSGEAKRLENIWIDIEGNDNLGVQYSTHCQSYGWMPWSCNGETNGTSGEAKRLEAIKIQLTGADKDKYDIYYRVHAQSYGWLGWAKNGEPSGTAGYAKRLEGIQIVVVKKGEAAPGLKFAGVDGSISKYSTQPYVAAKEETIVIPGDTSTPTVSYRTHVQSFGWQKWVYNGAMSGTEGKAKRLEGINIKVTNCPYEGDIVYTTHVQTYGWKDGKPSDATSTWKGKNGSMSGTSGEAKRLEAICIDLTGEMAEKYDIYYRVHAQSYGWLGWAKNGECSGTAGYAKRLEGIQIVLVEKGGAAPANNYGGITANDTRAYIAK